MRRSIAIIAAVSLGLAACSSGDSDKGDKTDKPETTQSESTSKEDESKGDKEADGDGNKLVIWTDETRVEPLKAAAKKFTKDTGIKVETVLKNFGDIPQEFVTQVPTGKGPDMTVGAHDWVGGFVDNGVIAPVDLGGNAGDFSETAVKAFTYNNQVYGLPYAVENIALIRNTELAPQAPKTWDEAIEMGKAAGTEFPILVQTGDKGDPYTYYPLQTSFGAPVFTQDDSGQYTSELGMGGAEGKAFANWLAEQGKAKNLSADVSYDIAVEKFKNGAAPFIIGGPWMLENFKDLKLSVDPIPAPGPNPAVPFAGVQGIYISAQSANSLAANKFLIEYVATEDVQYAMYEAGGRVPALTAAAEKAGEDPLAAGFNAVGADALPMPAIPEMGQVWEFWGVTEVAILKGDLAPDAAWEKMISDIEGKIASSK